MTDWTAITGDEAGGRSVPGVPLHVALSGETRHSSGDHVLGDLHSDIVTLPVLPVPASEE